mmetsp:Transcript_8126/g.24524  ORF Transcript_8126/g.24524 Transcript_8126/m.24524 type:complete len:271 (+) Transcript_8126:3208-4020(+)
MHTLWRNVETCVSFGVCCVEARYSSRHLRSPPGGVCRPYQYSKQTNALHHCVQPGFYAFPTKSLPCKLPWHAGLRGEQRARPRFLRPPLPPPRLRVKVAAVGSWRGARQRLHAACHGHPLAIDHGARGLCLAAVHGPKFGHLASLDLVHDLDGVGGRQVLKVVVCEALHTLGIVRDADHGCVGACAHALHLAKRKHSVGRRLANVDAQVLHKCTLNALRALQPARRCAADEHVVLADLGAVEHGVERCDLVYSNLWHLQDCGHLVHSTQA